MASVLEVNFCCAAAPSAQSTQPSSVGATRKTCTTLGMALPFGADEKSPDAGKATPVAKGCQCYRFDSDCFRFLLLRQATGSCLFRGALRPPCGQDVPGSISTEGLADRTASRSEERRVGKECRSRWWPY